VKASLHRGNVTPAADANDQAPGVTFHGRMSKAGYFVIRNETGCPRSSAKAPRPLPKTIPTDTSALARERDKLRARAALSYMVKGFALADIRFLATRHYNSIFSLEFKR
jgi:hypothetical protein